MAKDLDTGDYQVGYGKPPKANQFKKGQSGNPKGRPKTTPKLHDLVAREAARLITVTEGGKQIKIPQLDMIIRRLFRDAMQGDRNAAKLILQFVQCLPEPEDGEEGISEHDFMLLKQLLAAPPAEDDKA